MTIVGLHHVQIACPPGSEGDLRDFYGALLGLTEVPKPPILAARGGVWFDLGGQELHCGVEEDFRPARKAHPCLLVDDVDAVARSLASAGYETRWDTAMPSVRRLHTDDAVGNRLEIQQG